MSSERAAESLIAEVHRSAQAQGITLDPEQRTLLTEISRSVHGGETGGERSGESNSQHRDERVGFYVHGSAGRGKTWLTTEIFAAAKPTTGTKRRLHFHAFFQELQHRFGARVSAREAIEETVEDLLTGTGLLFFDEFHVHDPGGASLLNRLLGEISRRGVPTLITSNYAPEELLPNPVYHRVVEPSIRIIRERFTVRELGGGTDYRRLGGRGGRFASGRWILAEDDAMARAAGLEPPAAEESGTLLERHRSVRARAVRGSEVWFDFADLLESRSTSEDFLELAARFDSWVLTGVPPLSRVSRAGRQRLVTLLDVLVDQDHRLTVLAQTDRDGLVDIADPPADLFRAESRLALLRDS